jgi:hypothetical protein
MHHTENPSWLAVKPLQNAILHTDVTPQNVEASNAAASAKSTTANGTFPPRPIHVTTLQIPVLYEAVLQDVPPLYSIPPVLPGYAPSDCLPPPADGFDFVFHIGVAGRGSLQMECLGHKLGYYKPDVSGKYAPVVEVIPREFSNTPLASSAPFDDTARPIRGFGIGYETSQDEYATEIDVARLLSDMKKEGVEVCVICHHIEGIFLTHQQICSSMDAGHYLCDFTYYCSLAEVARTVRPEEKAPHPQVLFLHCPPTGQPLLTEEVTSVIKKIIIWVARRS